MTASNEDYTEAFRDGFAVGLAIGNVIGWLTVGFLAWVGVLG